MPATNSHKPHLIIQSNRLQGINKRNLNKMRVIPYQGKDGYNILLSFRGPGIPYP